MGSAMTVTTVLLGPSPQHNENSKTEVMHTACIVSLSMCI